MANKFKAHCKIINYLSAEYPEHYQLFEGTCLVNSLSARKGRPGLTVILPTGATLKKIQDLALSDDPDKENRGADMLNAMIFRGSYKTAADWNAAKIVPNSLFPSQKVGIKSASGDEVTFVSGAVAKLDPKFIDASHERNLAVYKLVSGEIPVTTTEPYGAEKSKGGKKGAYEDISAKSKELRWKIAIYVENQYANKHAARQTSGVNNICPYAEFTSSLVCHIAQADMGLFRNRVLPVLGCDKMDFYFLLEPHATSGDYLISDAMIQEWWSRPRLGAGVCVECKRLCEQELNKTTGAAVYSNRAGLQSAIHKIRKSLTDKMDARPREAVTNIESAYAPISTSNSIGNINDVYPADLASFYAAQPKLKMIQDELRYSANVAFARLESNWNASDYNELLNYIGESTHVILNGVKLQFMIAPGDQARLIKGFLWSTAFMHIPMTESEANSLRTANTASHRDDMNGVVFNIQKDAYARHNRLVEKTGDDISRLIDSIKSDMDPETKAKLLAKLQS